MNETWSTVSISQLNVWTLKTRGNGSLIAKIRNYTVIQIMKNLQPSSFVSMDVDV